MESEVEVIDIWMDGEHERFIVDEDGTAMYARANGGLTWIYLPDWLSE